MANKWVSRQEASLADIILKCLIKNGINKSWRRHVLQPAMIKVWLFSLCITVSEVAAAQQPLRRSQSKRQPSALVLNKDFPDPTVITANGKYYAYATQGRVGDQMYNIQ